MTQTGVYKAKIGVVHTSLNSIGGAEIVCIETVRALKEAGAQVDLITIDRTDWAKIKRIFDLDIDPCREFIVPPFVLFPTFYSKFVSWIFQDALSISYLRKNYDLIINTQPFLPTTFADMAYIQVPEFSEIIETYYPKYQNGLWRAYALPHDMLIKVSEKLFDYLNRKPLILTNSKYSEQVIENRMKLKPYVIYPPVHVNRYKSLSKRKKSERNLILTISRIEKDKRLELIPKVAMQVQDAKFVIIGTLKSGYSNTYLVHLYNIIRNFGVQDRVKIIPNANEEIKKDLLSGGKIYFQPRQCEPFGIAIVEAMAAGLIPLVHKSGGPWMDILDQKQGLYGYAYEDVISCVEFMHELLDNYTQRREFIDRIVKRSERFSSEIFRENLVLIAEALLSANMDIKSS